MTQTIPDIIQENEQRKKKLNAPYDPIMGVGSPLSRFPIFLLEAQKTAVMLPDSMRELPIIKQFFQSGRRSVEVWAKENGQNHHEVINSIHEARHDHDFEFWCVIAVKIKPKAGGENISFVLNQAQRKIINSFEADRLAGKPIRAILLKARQLGGSTVIQVYISWIQIRHKTNWNSLIAAHINQAATNIRAMIKTVITSYPITPLSLRPFEGTQNIKFIPERSNKITIGSMETPDSIRSDDVALFHGSEIGLWKKTDGKKPEDLIQSVLGTVPNLPLSLVALESTAKGVGNYFHRTWINAKKKGGYTPIFIAWFEIEMYQTPFDSAQEMEQLIATLSEYEQDLWRMGATLEGIKWYRDKLSEYNGDMVIMCSEFPSNDVEAFQSSGSRYFPMAVIQKARRFVKDPILIGDVYADSFKGPEALSNIKIERNNAGNLSVWSMPETFEDVKYLHRYCVTLDIGGRSKDSDDSVIKVWDRLWMMEGSPPELAACWAGHVDFDRLAWIAIQLCKLYDDAYFIPEINKMREDTSSFDEGDQFYTLVDEIRDYYKNIYCRTSPDQIRRGVPSLYGFHMNAQTKPMVLSALNAAYRDDMILNYDVRSMDQADSFENKGNGKTGAVEGAHDDHVITDALGAWGCLQHMKPVEELKLEAVKRRKSAGNIASF